jgi:hypothetical protein
MNRELAIKFLSDLQRISPQVDALFDLTDHVESEEERRVLREHIAEVIDRMGYHLVMHIVRQYPDLDPDKKS